MKHQSQVYFLLLSKSCLLNTIKVRVYDEFGFQVFGDETHSQNLSATFEQTAQSVPDNATFPATGGPQEGETIGETQFLDSLDIRNMQAISQDTFNPEAEEGGGWPTPKSTERTGVDDPDQTQPKESMLSKVSQMLFC